MSLQFDEATGTFRDMPDQSMSFNSAFAPGMTDLDQSKTDYYTAMTENLGTSGLDWTKMGIQGIGTGMAMYDQYFGKGAEIRDQQLATLQQNTTNAQNAENRKAKFTSGVASAFA